MAARKLRMPPWQVVEVAYLGPDFIDRAVDHRTDADPGGHGASLFPRELAVHRGKPGDEDVVADIADLDVLGSGGDIELGPPLGETPVAHRDRSDAHGRYVV